MNYRRLALGIGIVAMGASLLAIVYPGFLAFSLDRILISVIGVLALIQTLRVIQTRRHADLDEAMTPDLELPVPTPTPGEDFETVIGQFLDGQRVYYSRTRIRKALQSAALAVLTKYGASSKQEAKEALEAGTWTDDSYAAGFLDGENASIPSLRDLLPAILRRESSFQREIRHTIDAIAAIAGVTPQANDENTDTPLRHNGHNATHTPTQFTTTADDERYEFDDTTEDCVVRESHTTGHWRGVSVVALTGIGVGILVEQPAVLLAGVVGIGFAAYARSSLFSPGTVLTPGTVTIDRTLSADQPEPGDEIEVTVTITNESDRSLPDLRLVDGVPEALAVTNGSPRLGTALRPGSSTTFTYTVTARRGVHTFEGTTLVARDLTAAIEQERLVPVASTLTCLPTLRPMAEPVPLREHATQFVGRVETDSGGDGNEFYATREYRSGDTMSRIDWNRRARTGELTTIEFREERAATVLIVIDARETAYVSPEPHTPHAVDRAVEAAGQLFGTLSDSGDRVGITAVGSEDCWLAPDTGVDHKVEARTLLATHPALSPVPIENRSSMFHWRKRLRKRLSPGTQIIFLTPLCDEYGERLARQLDEYGYPVTVVTPDPTTDRTPSHRLSRVSRTLCLSALRSTGIPVIDWPRDETVAMALARYNERWSQ